ncbi:MAG TPA: hypothetical protein PK987_01850, partial [Ferruginibacter sp.]|nr:hypothetical protein [Ferruginibacter sp.]
NTREEVIRKNLFFREGDPVFPYLLADNERFLRELAYIKDVKIFIDSIQASPDSVDIIVLTKDVFSIGGKLLISSTTRGRGEIREENFLGTGTRLLLSGYYESDRNPPRGIGGELVSRNIGGSFIDYTIGYQDYGKAFSSDRNQETVFYTRLEKPLVTAYKPSTGAMEWSYRRTRNVYNTDSVYLSDFKYAYYSLDGWFGYSLDSKRSLYANKEIRVHKFLALRGFKQFYQVIPQKAQKVYNPSFADYEGALASFNIFKQVFYKTSFIYGFGVVEDIPEGFSAAVTTGYINKQNFKRPYGGIVLSLSNFKNQGKYFDYTLKFGGYYFRHRFEDVDLLFDINHFSRLKKIRQNWYNRFFISTGIAAQVNPALNLPLYLNSNYGLPYFNNDSLKSDLRATIKTETVFYNTKKFLGFRFAPFMFADGILVKPSTLGLKYSDIFTAVGGGVRTRNDNLVFGTIELKWYYFPRTNGNMNVFKIELNSNLRFKFRNNLSVRPDFVSGN